MKLITPINDIQTFTYGGKGNYIAKLYKSGLKIPKTWLLSSEVMKKYLQYYKDGSKDLEANFNQVLNSNLFNILLKEIRELKHDNPTLKRIAIRSSHAYEVGKVDQILQSN